MASSLSHVVLLLGSTLSLFTVLHWDELQPLRSAAWRFISSSPSELAHGSAQAAIRRLTAMLQRQAETLGDITYDDDGIQAKVLQFSIAETDLQAKAEQAESWLQTLQRERQSLRKQRRAASSAASALTRLGSFQAEHGRSNAAVLGLQRAVKIMKNVVVEEEEEESDAMTNTQSSGTSNVKSRDSTGGISSADNSDEKGSELVTTAKAEAALANALCAGGGQNGTRQTQAKALFGESLQMLNRVDHHNKMVGVDIKLISANIHASLAHCLHLNGDLSASAAMLRVAAILAKASNTSKGRNDMVPHLARLLGGVRHDEGSTEEAIRLYEQYLIAVPLSKNDVDEEHGGPAEVFETLQDHALATASIGHPEQALQVLNDVQLLQEKVNTKLHSKQPEFPKEQRPDLALLASNARSWQVRAEILLNDVNKVGDKTRLEAVAASAQAIPILKKLKDEGEGLRQLSDALNTHGNALTAVGRAAEAEAAYKQALDVSLELHGRNSPLTAAVMHNLGASLARQGKNHQALELLNEALSILRQTLGDNPDVSAALASIASILRKQGKMQEALSAMRKALDVAKKTLPPDHNSRKQYETILKHWEEGR